MRQILSSFAVVSILALFGACYWDNPPEPVPIDPLTVSYLTHVQPIFDASCATANCHDATWAPDLRAEYSWQALQAGGYLNLTFPRESEIFKSVEFGSMPPVGELTATEKQLILAWIMKGAFND